MDFFITVLLPSSDVFAKNEDELVSQMLRFFRLFLSPLFSSVCLSVEAGAAAAPRDGCGGGNDSSRRRCYRLS